MKTQKVGGAGLLLQYMCNQRCNIGLVHFTDLIDELERAISGAKYGDYIMTGRATRGISHYIIDIYPPHSFIA